MTTTLYEIPLNPNPERFNISIAGTSYTIATRWINVSSGGGWVLDLMDASGNNILNCIPLITGANLLAQYSYLNLPFSLVVSGERGTDAAPTYTGLGTTSHLYFGIQS